MILWSAMGTDDSLSDEVTALRTMLHAERAAWLAAEAEAWAGTLLIEKLKLTNQEAPARAVPTASERGALLDQLELQLTELEQNAAQMAAERIAVPSFERRKKNFAQKQ
ncbi:hypothetical protein [Bradyrhizobium sp. Ec3.3]|uniref:hypothetical protein n=1 Tax=Bradyrhizobium sp. Ec3.3 TaxID=189753 RepID=UPI0004290811|nr:hypothetical protein [Bradyrhizobium sp. Ec3.3]